MVSTRQHPSEFPPPDLPASLSPTKQSSPSKRSTSGALTKRASPSESSNNEGWVHKSTDLTLLWLAVSLPLVIWDTGYVLLRPHSMPGGKLHWPLWTPYELYGTVDHIYGFPAYNANNGFTAAQGSLNAVETALYLYYVWIVVSKGVKAKVPQGGSAITKLGWAREVNGKAGATAVLILFATSLMTLSKTILYWANEAFSGFNHIGHNDISSLVVLWIIPNGLWLIFPTYILFVYGPNIVEGLSAASGPPTSKKVR